MRVIAVVVADLAAGFFGTPARLSDELAGRTVLNHTVTRAGRVQGVDHVVVVHPAGQEVASLLSERKGVWTLPVVAEGVGRVSRLASARVWATSCWRGGLGGACVYDELLPAGPIIAAMDEHDATSAVIVRGDWCVFDPALASRQLAVHVEAPEQLGLCFSQAPPGLGSVVAHRVLLEEIVRGEGGSFGQMLGYSPRRPRLDPIGREVCVPIEPMVRDAGARFVYDLSGSMAVVRRVAAVLGEGMVEADARAVVQAALAKEPRQVAPLRGEGERVIEAPEVVTLELTPRRVADGPVVPQASVRLERHDMAEAVAVRRVREAAGEAGEAGEGGGGSAILLGGLGDALLHRAWDRVIEAAHEAGALGVGVETDLLCDDAAVDRLIELGRAGRLDLVSVRLNADKPETYRKVMGVDGFPQVFDRLRRLIAGRGEGERGGRYPWVVVRLVKTADTLGDLESFFTRWSRVAGVQPVIDGPSTGAGVVAGMEGGLVADLAVVPMEPPRRRPCRQLGRRLTVLSDGRPTMCDRDWLGMRPLGTAEESLDHAWSRVAQPVALHAEGRWDELDPCVRCGEWFRP